MPDEIQNLSDYADSLRVLQQYSSQIAAAVEHKRQMAAEEYSKLEEKYQNGEMPTQVETIWENHRNTLQQASQRAEAFVQNWNQSFPIIAQDKADRPF